MKKLLALLLALVMALALCACAPTVILTENHKHEFDSFDITINDFGYADSYGSMGTNDKQEFVILNYSVHCKKKEKTDLKTFYPSRLVFDNDYEYSALGENWFTGQINDRDSDTSIEVHFVVDSYVMDEKDKPLVIEFSVLGEKFSYIPSENYR